jgi:hypothetical protein
MANDMAQATKAVELAKEQITACDQQNAVYKTALRNLTNATAAESDTTTNNNTVSIEWIKVGFFIIFISVQKLFASCREIVHIIMFPSHFKRNLNQ